MTPNPPPPNDRDGLLFVLLLIAACIALMATHRLVPGNCLDPYNGDTPLAVTYEVIVHALLGITCRMAYMVGRGALSGGIDLTRMVTLWLCTALFGCGMVLALVFILRALSLNVNGLDVGLGFTRIETTAAVAFVLGFFNEAPRRLLSLVRTAVRTGPDP